VQQQQQLDFAGLVAMRTFTVKRGVPANDTPKRTEQHHEHNRQLQQFRVTLFSFRKKNFKKRKKYCLSF
jgi:hypothetical protein